MFVLKRALPTLSRIGSRLARDSIEEVTGRWTDTIKLVVRDAHQYQGTIAIAFGWNVRCRRIQTQSASAINTACHTLIVDLTGLIIFQCRIDCIEIS
jgi:hypothetical protein